MSGPSSGPTATSSTASYPSAYAPSPSSSTLNSEPPSLHLASKAHEPNRVLSNAQGVGSRGERGTMHPTDSDLTETQPGGSLRKRDSGSYRRHLQRGSGGFLLESAFTSAARPQDPHPRSQEVADSRIIQKDNGKGIEATDAAEGRTSKQHRRHRRYHTSSSLGSSPLSREVTIAKHQHGDNEASNNRDETSALGSDGGRVSDVATTDRAVAEKPQGNTMSNQQQNTFSQDTDPLRIVNIALNLSQSRRKGTNATRFNAGNILNARRTVSAAGPGLQEVPSNGPLLGGSLKQHLQQQRRTSRNISPTPDRGIQVVASPNLRERKSGSALQAISSPRQDQEYIYSFSKSTLARAEKARVSLGLSAEYMRLLQLLPPLNANSNGSGNPYSTAPNSPITNESRNQLSRFVSGSSASGAAGNRPYNPLQYIRNRKVRARERRTIDAEADGWANLENVRNWVNTVELEASNPSFQSGDRVLLPQFPGRSQDTAVAPQSPQTGRLGRSNTASTKPKRPRVDWQISPAELFADAFWLELEGNKRLIEDSHGNKIYPYDSSVIRHDSTVENEQRAAESVIKLRRTGDRAREGYSTGSNIKMPSFTAKLEHDLDAGNGNGRRRRKIHKLRHHDDNTRFGRKSLGWRKDGSTLNDSSGASSDEEASRGRHRGRRKDKQDIAGSQALEKLEVEARERELGSASGIAAPKSDRVADTSSVANGNFATGYVHPLGASESLKALPIPTGRSQESLQRSRSGSASTNPGEGPQAPPDKFDFVPGIAANLSPLHSRASSPVRSSIVKAGAKIGLFRAERGKERENYENDLEGNYPNEQHHRQISVDTDQGSGERRGSSPIKKTASRTAGKNAGKEAHLADNKLPRDDRDEKEPESSRRRGIFKGGRKGGRIEEIVRNEVSKVGVLIRKKEGPSSNSVVSSATASSISSSDSDRGSPVRGRSKGKRVASLSPSGSNEDRVMAGKGSHFGLPEYHPPHLPTFTSPFGHEERIPADAGTSPEGDHITRQQMAQREVRRPSKFLRHAPPKIDINTLPELTRAGTGDSDMTRQTDTLDTSDADSRRNSYGFGSVLGNTANVHHANRRFNAMLGMPSGSKLRPPVTGLTALDASNRRRASKRPSGSEEQRKWSISDQDVPTPCDFPVTRREIARLKVLWLSSGVKAQQISNRANEVKKPSSSLVPDKPGLSIPRAPRSEEHILAAQIHSSEMQRTSHLLNETANYFRRSTVNDIHNRITAIREHVSVRLAPLVQDAADDADALSMELSTKHTLAVKKLNDRVDKMIRRRKRRLKKLRKWGYVLLEWTLLGLMWWAWLIVVIVRTIRITFKGFAKGVRWLLWL
ncbi:MAG: hypothetical protein M1839_002720 [Geoglossum umbratile]|nr:MAG: hypothetical protein M1839_002720 [Geoglossum umbratile]